MTEPLALPQRWVDELEGQRLALVTPVLNLSVLQAGVPLPDGCSTDDVKADLERGAWLVRDGQRTDRFRLGGDGFEVSVHCRPAKNSRQQLAVATRVTLFDAVPPTARIRPKVEFVSVFQELYCDLQAVLREVEHASTVRTQLRRGRQPEGLRRQSDLQAKVSKQYGQLGTLLDLLDERAARQPELALEGTVLAGTPPRIEVDGPVDGLYRRRVTIRVDGDDEYQTQVNRARGRVVTVEAMRGWEVPAGTRVTVVAASRFGMRQNAEALQRFRLGAVEGCWEDLAQLLCDPKQLRMPGEVPVPARFFADLEPDGERLNDAQRAAVAGALATPHAYLIQGPPGTGKTTVISELIQQLVAKGERVLMLAPSHVSVDEVLRRVGPKPDVRALRITWSADKVDAELHPYLFDQVGRDLAHRVLRESAGRRARWERRVEAIDADTATLTELQAALQHERRERSAHEAADRELARARADHEAARQTAEREAERAAETRREAADLARAARGLADESGAEAARLEHEVRPKLVALRAAAGRAAAAIDAVERAQESATDADTTVAGWTRHIDRIESRLRQWREYAPRAAPEINNRLAVAAERTEALRAQLDTTLAGPSGWLDQVGLSPALTRLRQDLANAEGDWRLWSASRAELDRSARAAAADERTLADYRANRAAWERLQTERRARLEHAKEGWAGAADALAAALAEAVRTTPRRPDVTRHGAAAWRDLCTTLIRDLDDALGASRQAWSPTDRPALRGLNTVLHGYRRALRQRTEDAARLAESDAALDRAERAADEAQRRVELVTMRGTAAILAATRALDERGAALDAAAARCAALQAEPVGDLGTVAARLDALGRERDRLGRYLTLRDRWERLTADRQPDDLVEDLRRSFVRATNVVCATTKGIVSRGSQPVRDVDYDTLIVDEASRVTESEFLIGAVRARRWILVGDEYQLPPHVDGEDEHHLHALTAIHRTERGAAASVADAVTELAALWEEDEELHTFRRIEVTRLAEDLLGSGDWAEGYRETFTKAYRHFGGDGGDADLLRAMLRYLVHSLFQRAVLSSRVELRQRLRVQRRMVPALSRIVRRPVYGGDYVDPEPVEFERLGLHPITTPVFPAPAIFIDTTRYDGAGGEQIGTSFANALEREAVQWAMRTYDQGLLDAGVRSVSVSVLSFYKAQATLLAREIRRTRWQVLEPKVIDVIDAIQGQQADIVFLSFARATTGRPSARFGRWLQDVRRLNVACTRARRALVLVGHARTLRQLHGVDQATRFYSHLFTLFDTDPAFQLMARFK